MANVTFLEPSGSNLLSNQISRTGLTNLTVTRNSAPWINSNYPEAMGLYGANMAFSDNGYYLNQQTVKGDAEVFYSHTNRSGRTFKVRVHIYNCSASSVTVQRTNEGHSVGWTTSANAVKEYFQGGNVATYNLASGASAWLTDEITVPAGQPVSGMIHLNATNNIIVTVYAYFNASTIKGTEVAFPFNDISEVYTGLGTGYFLTFNHKSLSAAKTKVSALASAPYAYAVNSGDAGEVNPNEMVPIHILGTDEIAAVGATHSNIGNWGAHNYHIIKFTNDTSSAATIYGYIGSNLIGNTQVINRGGVVKSATLNGDTGKFQWRWCRVDLDAGEDIEFDFQQVLASYGASASIMRWELA